MSPLAEKPPDPIQKVAAASAKIAEPIARDPVHSSAIAHGVRVTFGKGRSLSISESRSDPSSERSIQLDFERDEGPAPAAGRLTGSLAVLSSLRISEPSAAAWMDAAATLKSDAARLRRSPLSRHSSVLLALADALTFTEHSDPTLDFQRSTLDRSLSVLSSPFIAESEEEALLSDLLSHGWNLAPAASEEPLSV